MVLFRTQLSSAHPLVARKSSRRSDGRRQKGGKGLGWCGQPSQASPRTASTVNGMRASLVHPALRSPTRLVDVRARSAAFRRPTECKRESSGSGGRGLFLVDSLADEWEKSNMQMESRSGSDSAPRTGLIGRLACARATPSAGSALTQAVMLWPFLDSGMTEARSGPRGPHIYLAGVRHSQGDLGHFGFQRVRRSAKVLA
jgi:hypothetical protein